MTASRQNYYIVGKGSDDILFLDICLRCWIIAGQVVALPGGPSPAATDVGPSNS